MQLARALLAGGPQTTGAAASGLGWGASRAWRAEAALGAANAITHDDQGRAALKALREDFEALDDPLNPRAWR